MCNSKQPLGTNSTLSQLGDRRPPYKVYGKILIHFMIFGESDYHFTEKYHVYNFKSSNFNFEIKNFWGRLGFPIFAYNVKLCRETHTVQWLIHT